MRHQSTPVKPRLVTTEQTIEAVQHAYSNQVGERLITDKEVAHLLGASRSWPWKLAQDGRLPAPIRITERCTRWRLSEIRAWMADPQGWQAANAPKLEG
ncbi:AlpA family transcriptional regulator [Kerstersia gyiorum]|uniref:AlpA family transcriptional regulator n=1 Tax=Kerstersia gyiorum TaxID=206506 RepID=A0A4Q7MWP0_9BURK|nr:AlpA family phage regulatory protein [Kerstersia gyiorum]KAB0544172.1 AlpA family phage regulatory protein [Kerstersia gyiorum]RZS73154.1 AlpA family transcriptional regulator [Kerstersia gyiorum]